MSLSRKDTLMALELVKPAVSSTNDSIQERAHIWFGDGYVYGTNGGLGIKAKFESPFKCGVPGGLLMGLLNQASSDTLEFKQSGDSALKFKAGRSSITLATLPFTQMPWRFPEKPSKKAICTIKVSADFVKGLKRVLALRASQPKRMEHHAVCIFKVDEEMDLYTIIGKESMSVIPVKEEMAGPATKIALPRELANQIVSQCKVGQMLNMYSDHFRVQASDKLELFSNVFDTTEMLDLPTFLESFTNEKKFPSTVIPADLIAGLERAVVLAGSDETRVLLKSEGKRLQMSGKFRFGEISEEFDLAKAPVDATVQVDARTLLSIKDVKKFSMHPKAMSFFGEDDFIYTVASSYDERRVAGPAEETDEEAEEQTTTRKKTKTKEKRKIREEPDEELNDDLPDNMREEDA